MPDLSVRRGLLALAIAALQPALPALAVQTQIGFEFSEDFEGYPLGPLELPYSYVPPTPTFRLTGGAVAIGTPDLPARSGSQVYISDATISLGQVPGSDDYFHAASVHVSGSAPVTFTAMRLGGLTSFSLISPSNARNYRFSFTADDLSLPGELPYIISIILSSPEAFAIDDIVIGEQTSAAPVPEPASWAMLIAGFGLIGGVARRQRLATA